LLPYNKDKFKGFKRFDKKGIEKADPKFYFETLQYYELQIGIIIPYHENPKSP
jgi:hypothetical protein